MINQLESLRVFKAVVECGTFTAAAKRLGITTARVSKAIEKLELELATPLFIRSTRHMQITEGGEHCYQQALVLLEGWQDLKNGLDHAEQKPSGKLRISLPMTWTLYCFDHLITGFMRLYPDIELDIHLSDQHVNILSDEFDLVLRLSTALPDSNLLCRTLTRYDFVTCATPAYLQKMGRPTSPEDLRQHHCLVYTRPGAPLRWSFARHNKTQDIHLQPRLQVNNSQLLHTALLADQGIVMMPDFIVADDLKTGRVVNVLPEYQTACLNLYALRPNTASIPRRLECLLNYLSEQLSRNNPGLK
ncbi:LysR family transcriptional regulator [Aliamphritea ceti]|uniref:LysR family transcriptional regulator n=1 Tax=Aliamphritea ceti TaxID=1524258 RepID=UPI0021C48C82|nr:LysR family transcriptional regulator [Aliamphritea ceti]